MQDPHKNICNAFAALGDSYEAQRRTGDPACSAAGDAETWASMPAPWTSATSRRRWKHIKMQCSRLTNTKAPWTRLWPSMAQLTEASKSLWVASGNAALPAQHRGAKGLHASAFHTVATSGQRLAAGAAVRIRSACNHLHVYMAEAAASPQVLFCQRAEQ
jgi:hypothetical protein